MSIKKKILITYIIAILIPGLLFATSFKMIQNEYNKNIDDFKEQEIIRYDSINKAFFNTIIYILKIDPFLKNESNKKHLNNIVKETPLEISIKHNNSFLFQSSHFNTDMNIKKTIQINENIYELKISRFNPFESFTNKISENLKLIIIFFIIIYTILHIFFLKFIYKTIINPISNMKKFANEIKNENFDYKINYKSKDEIGQVYKAFDNMRIKLKDSQQKNQKYKENRKKLIANISHDLKTPITAIKGYINGIIDGVAKTKKKEEEYFKIIKNYINDMDKLINDLFLFSKLDIDKIQFNFQKIALEEYFDDCIEEIKYPLKQRNINLKYYFDYNKNTFIKIDPKQLKRVINNIIFNSIKYLDKSYKKITIKVTNHKNGCKIIITDNGKGIKKENLNKMFNQFYKIDKSRKFEGSTGLGLSISKKIIEAHGGYIYAKSTIGKGTSIIFTLKNWEEKNEENINN
ncbi:MAG: HAMP domain-containing sensor histidine kinase [Bacillota bacterium]